MQEKYCKQNDNRIILKQNKKKTLYICLTKGPPENRWPPRRVPSSLQHMWSAGHDHIRSAAACELTPEPPLPAEWFPTAGRCCHVIRWSGDGHHHPVTDRWRRLQIQWTLHHEVIFNDAKESTNVTICRKRGYNCFLTWEKFWETLKRENLCLQSWINGKFEENILVSIFIVKVEGRRAKPTPPAGSPLTDHNHKDFVGANRVKLP